MIEAYSDSILTMRMLCELDDQHSFLCKDIVDAISLVKYRRVEGFYHMKREANSATYALANFTNSIDCTMAWKFNFPTL